ncbi:MULTISPECIES: alpha/beta hydrolase [unclassified Corynebacterium]|uniref:alpha/beta hydrolase n=1 Tax=unclassified Corynebacterium TaxID=2624378 RepID=UPI0029C9C518|nr:MULTISPECIES: alpha/beta hydrolase [unclassified Corynebacterium]WPF66462.1 alpha/beta hydrolase [Corynebacterium sp. 22KM0430]WPF68952.1 alpha/beta hydrolase [Corynebacterium sp. 21KM1197]
MKTLLWFEILGVIILMALGATLFNYGVLIGVLALVFVLAMAGARFVMSAKKARIELGLAGVFEVCQVLWLIGNTGTLWALSRVVLVVYLLYLFYRKAVEVHRGARLRGLGVVSLALLLVVSAGASYLTYATVNPSIIARTMMGENSFESIKTRAVDFDSAKYTSHFDVEYAEDYPNSYLDIVTLNDGKPHPTYFYVHGGGFTAGDKMVGDPNTKAQDDYMAYFFTDMLEQGYNVVSINYALAPEYIYPVATRQADQAVRFLQENGDRYGISMDDVVFAGGSAGGYIAAGFVTAQLDPAYAESIGVAPAMSKDQIKAMVLESPALNPAQSGKTQAPSVLADYIFQTILGSYLDTTSVSPDKTVMDRSNLIAKVNAAFPPTFLSDGNNATFPDQSIDYQKALESYGIKSEVYIPNREEVGAKGHGYMVNLQDPTSKVFLDKRREFLSSLG